MLEQFDKKDWERRQRRCADPLKVFSTQLAESARSRKIRNLRVKRMEGQLSVESLFGPRVKSVKTVRVPVFQDIGSVKSGKP